MFTLIYYIMLTKKYMMTHAIRQAVTNEQDKAKGEGRGKDNCDEGGKENCKLPKEQLLSVKTLLLRLIMKGSILGLQQGLGGLRWSLKFL